MLLIKSLFIFSIFPVFGSIYELQNFVNFSDAPLENNLYPVGKS